jgi:hypothetical protein
MPGAPTSQGVRWIGQREIGSPARSALDRASFAREVKRALRCVGQPCLLVGSPLVDRFSPSPDASPAARVEHLRSALLTACRAVRDEDGDLRGWSALDRTYLRPAVKQLAAADDLGLSYATYRRALAAATERVVARLWAQEPTGPSVRLAYPGGCAAHRAPDSFCRRFHDALRTLRGRGRLDDPQLEDRLRRALDAFAASPRDADIHRVLESTFFEPATPQREIARRLGIPYGSYRRYLAQGIERIATTLWLEDQRAGGRADASEHDAGIGTGGASSSIC